MEIFAQHFTVDLHIVIMLFLILFYCFFVADGLPFHSLSDLSECPNVEPVKNVQVEQIAGSWRLGYLFYNDEEHVEEDDSCVIGEFKPTSSNRIDIAMHVDFKDREFIIDRTSMDLTATFHDPSQWLLHANSTRKAYLHVTVIHLTDETMILTLCISKALKMDETSIADRSYENILDGLKKEGDIKYRNGRGKDKSNELEQILHNELEQGSHNELDVLFDREKYFRRKRSVFDKFRALSGDTKAEHSADSEGSAENHFWTVILTRDNNVSAFNFVENAALLMKYGFDLRKGTLRSLGKCNI